MQIVQFISSFFLSVIFLYFYNTQDDCIGLPAFYFSCACNASFLLLFISFEKRTYGTRSAKRGKPTAEGEKAD